MVVSAVDYGEADRILTLLTREMGRISARAPGARRSQKRFAGRLDRFALVAVRLSGPPHRLTLLEAELEEPFLGLRDRLESSAAAAYVVEVSAALSPEGEAQPRIFGLVLEALAHLAEADGPPSPDLLRAFELKALDAAGLMPALDACAACGGPLAGEGIGFSPAGGGAVCPDHAAADPAASPLSPADVHHLRALARAPLGEPRADVGRAAHRRQASALRTFLDAQLGRRPRSAAFLEQVMET
ncbi:DNA repair protein RecO [Myxococcota bacterium]|nr:DNA repair protein RecO [Myxococcota bacterium]